MRSGRQENTGLNQNWYLSVRWLGVSPASKATSKTPPKFRAPLWRSLF